MTEFFKTRMGHAFFESTVPRIAKALERIAAALEAAPATVQAPTSATSSDTDGGAAEAYWFVAWEELSQFGTSNHSDVLVGMHPFEWMERCREKYADMESRVVCTLLTFRPITAQEYQLAEAAGLA